MINKKYGRLLVIALIPTNKIFCWVKCNCGTIKQVRIDPMKRGKIISCGCYNRAIHTTHNKYKTRSYQAWRRMKGRCFNHFNSRYKDYGGRGITICKRWLSFPQFFEDMGEAPPHLSLDRIDNNGNYEPNNCRWATQKQQSNNMRTNRILEYKGIKRTLPEWAKIVGIDKSTLSKRILRSKWSIEEALLKPEYYRPKGRRGYA